MNKTYGILGLLAAVALLASAIAFRTPDTSVSLGGFPISANPKLGSNIFKNVSTTVAVKVFSVNSGAQYRACTNTGGGDLTLSATTTGLTYGTGFVLRASSSVTFSGDSLFTGDIYVTGTSTVGCLEI
jgi:hypothetical protein